MSDMSTAQLRRHRWTRDEWSQFDAEAYRHCELIDGEIIDMASMASPHALVTDHIRELFTVSLLERPGCCGSQTPIVLDDYNEPEPDIWVARVPRAELEIGKPQPHELDLVVEVADSTIRSDRRLKMPVYARAGLPEVWLVDVGERTIDVLRSPVSDDSRYADRVTAPVDATVVAPWGAEFAVADLLAMLG